MNVTTINMFLKAVLFSIACISVGVNAEGVKAGEEVGAENQAFLGPLNLEVRKNDEVKDDIIVTPSAGCPTKPCPGKDVS